MVHFANTNDVIKTDAVIKSVSIKSFFCTFEIYDQDCLYSLMCIQLGIFFSNSCIPNRMTLTLNFESK